MTKTLVVAATLVIAAPMAAFACSGAKNVSASADSTKTYTTAQIPSTGSTSTEVK